MPATIVVGGQYGSEGKGKIVALLSSRVRSPWIVRCGGPNSGHTVTIGGTDVILRQVPSCTQPEKATLCIAAGCAVDEAIILRELDLLRIDQRRIIVDPRAVLVRDEDREAEARDLEHIASTCSGTGSALLRRMARRGDVVLARDSKRLRERCRIETVAPLLHAALESGNDVFVEGTQGFGLSLLHGFDYPFVTSRDTTAAGFAMEVGLSPRAIDKIVVVIRTFPIRVGGTSGPFSNEISWEQIRALSGAPETKPEFTSVTKRLRRVAEFDMAAVKIACRYNRPTSLAVMGLDRLDYEVTGATDTAELTTTTRQFLDTVTKETGVPVEFVGTGFGTFDVISIGTDVFLSAHANV